VLVPKAPLPTLLVVDDEPEVLRSLYDLFRREYQVITFERGSDALASLEAIDPPVVMSDQRMPGLTGVEFLREVKKRRPEAVRLLFTGYADLQAVIEAINQGHVFRYIAKPWDPRELSILVRQAHDQHKLLVERRRLIAELQATNARLEVANRLKSSFIEVASHELNTPVAVILGMTDLWAMSLGKGATSQELAWVERIRVAGRRLAGTVERMLTLLQTDRLGETLVLHSTPLEPLLKRVADNVAPFLEARHQQLEIHADPALGSAEIDQAKVEDLFTNLLVNAIKFTPDGGRVLITAAPAGADELRIAVTDTGVGIPNEEQPHLFEPFFTGYDTMRHSSGHFEFGKRGIGLGLSLVKRYVEMHNGRIDVESTPGSGSTFSVYLPRRSPSSPASDWTL
jgi:signal transduction histidine kinase